MSHAPEIRRLKNGAIDIDAPRTQAAALRGAAIQDALKVKAAFRVVVTTVAIGFALAAAASVPKALAQTAHAIVGPNEVKWSPGPPSIPPGAQAAVLYGDPGKEGLFVLRLKLPKVIGSRRTPIRSRRSSPSFPARSGSEWERRPIKAKFSPGCR